MSKKKKKEEDKEVHDLLGIPESDEKKEEQPKEKIFLGYHPITKEEVWK